MPIAKGRHRLALHDLAGKLAGQSLLSYGDKKPLERIPLSWTVIRRRS